MNGIIAMMPMLQDQVTLKESSSKSTRNDLFSNLLSNLSEGSEAEEDLIVLKENLLSETEVKELLSNIVESLIEGHDALEQMISELSFEDVEQLLNSLEQLFNEDSSFFEELGEEKLNALGQFLFELHNQLSEEDLIDFESGNVSEQLAYLGIPMNQIARTDDNQSNGRNPSLLNQTEQNLARVIASLLNQHQPTTQQNNQSNERWQNLLKQIKSQLNSPNLNQPAYQHTKDVTAIKQALSKILNQQPANISTSRVSEGLVEQNPQMSKLEQYTIHLSRANGNQTSNNLSNQQQIIEQLQKIIQSSQFGRTNGTNNLTIQLKPANLGQMTLQFTQIDGQMAVKISVMSNAAREMLESNMNQLRHIFHPNQVVVERQVDQTNTDHTKEQLSEHHEQSSEEQAFEEGQQEEKQDEQPSSQFKDYLFEEEV
ncbi:flagellar hook-length control protein FliK [Alkalibacillus silvisoli]|uniref:Flagellar hook-length control protein-like C-terminal domain-containing protein n=1 Tax=Alkalibacillus silvisoli TaxID=392823 RepID=A0ABP3JQP9_9BACI